MTVRMPLKAIAPLLWLTASRGALRAGLHRQPISAAVGRTRTLVSSALREDEDQSLADSDAVGFAAATLPSPQLADDLRPCQERLLLIDGHALAYRMHFAMQKTGMSTRKGEATHALHGFCSKLLDLHKRWPTHRMLVCFDLPGGSHARQEEFAEYKANRPAMPDPLRHQVKAMFEASDLFGAPALAVEGFEADDLIAACASAAKERGFEEVVICSGDKDLLQLVSDGPEEPTHVIVWDDRSKALVDAAAVEAKHGVRPSQMGDLLALVGDASDNVPGIPGIGAKTAAQLIAAHGSLDAVLEGAARLTKPTKRSTTLVENAEVARRARRLVELNADAPLDHAVVEGGAPTFENLDGFKQFCARWELFSVMRNAEALATQANAQRLQGLKWGNAARVVGPSEAGQEAGVSHAAKEEEEEETAPMVTDPMVTDGGSPAQAMFEEHAVAAAPAAANGAATTAAIEPSVAGVAGDALQSAPGASDPGASAAEAAAEAAWLEALQKEQEATRLARIAEESRDAAKAAAKEAKAARKKAIAADKAAETAAAKAAEERTRGASAAPAAAAAAPATGAAPARALQRETTAPAPAVAGATRLVSECAPDVPF